MPGARARSLLRIGTSLRRAQSAGLTFAQVVSLLLSTCLLCLALAGLALTASSHALHQARAHSLLPQQCQDSSATLLYRFAGFTQVGNRAVTVVLISPLSDDAPLPPGVSHWPGPGQSVVSPALAGDLDGPLSGLFGPVAGQIGLDGLEVPQERRVYVRPSARTLRPAAMLPVCGFGGSVEGGGYSGSGSLYSADLTQVILLVCGVLILPGACGCLVSARTRAKDERARVTALIACGLRRHELALIDLAHTWPGVLAGAATACVLTAWAMWADIHLPWVDAWFPAADTRLLARPVLTGLGAGACCALLIVLAARAAGRWRVAGTRRREERVSAGRIPPALMTCGLLAAIWFPWWNPGSVYKQLVYTAGVVLVVMSLPRFISLACAQAGRLLAVLGLRRARPCLLIAGRQLASLSRTSSHVTLAIVLMMLAVGQVQLWTSALTPQYRQSVAILRTWGEKVAVLDDLDAAARRQAVLDVLPEDAAVFAVHAVTASDDGHPPSPDVVVEAGCPLLRSWGLVCQDREEDASRLTEAVPFLAQVSELTMPGRLQIRVAGDDAEILEREDLTTAYLMSLSADLDVRSIEKAVNAVAPGVQVISPPQEWITAGAVNVLRSRWILLLGTCGLLVMIVVLGTALAHDATYRARYLAPVGVVSGSASCAAGAAWWHTSVLMVVAGVSSAAAYWLLPVGMTRVSGPHDLVTWNPSVEYVGVCLLVTLVGASCAGWQASRAAWQAAARWRP